MEENYYLLQEAYERLSAYNEQLGIPMTDIMTKYDITQEELDQMEEVEFE